MADNTRDALALLAHELRTPVGTIVAAARDLERGGDTLPPEKQRALVQLVAGGAERLARLVDDVLAASQLEAGTLPVVVTDIEIGPLVGNAVEAARSTATAGRSVTGHTSDALVARRDADRLRQVIDNLIDNAMKHASGAVSVTASRHGTIVRIGVADDGAGVRSAERGRSSIASTASTLPRQASVSACGSPASS